MGIGWPADKWGSTAPFLYAPGRCVAERGVFKTYWLDPRQWPGETRSHVPLARSVLEIGAATIEGWTGRETQDAAGLTAGLRPFAQAGREDRCRAHGLLEGAAIGYIACPNFKRMPGSFAAAQIKPSWDLPDYDLCRSDYERALAIIGEKNAPFVPGALRLEKAKEAFIRAATMGEISTAVREAKSYQTYSLNPDIWSVVNPWNVFAACVLNPSELRSIYVSGDKYLPVMVERGSFEAWLGERRKKVCDDVSKAGVRVGRAVNDPLGPMNQDVRRAIEAATAAWTMNKMAREDDVFGEVRATGNPISRRAFDDHVIPAARQAASAPARRGPRPKPPPAI